MISIIISSVNDSYLSSARKNIEETIGVPYEIISIKNGGGNRGLCEIYNTGASKAAFEVLCFMHEDIEIRTRDWGLKVIDHFNSDDNLGLIGVVGSSYKSSVFSGWGPYGSTGRVDYANIIQAYKFKEKPTFHYYHNPNNDVLTEVAVLDGVWLCSRRDVIRKHPFDQETFTKFHCYDIDICLSIGHEFKVAVVYDVLLKHFSEGKFEEEWTEATVLFHKKWKKKLPVNKAGFTKKDILVSEKRSFRNVIPILQERGYSLRQILSVLNLSKVWELSPYLYIKLCLNAVQTQISRISQKAQNYE